MKDTKVEASVKIVGNKAEVIVTDEVKPGTHDAVIKDIPKIIAAEPAKISYLKSDFISTVAVLAASDAEWKLEDILPHAEEVCQAAGERYNEMLMAEQERELKKAIEKEEITRYVRVEYYDGDIQYWKTTVPSTAVGNDRITTIAIEAASAHRPFMSIRTAVAVDQKLQGEGVKVVNELNLTKGV